jgi:hypothetical protein
MSCPWLVHERGTVRPLRHADRYDNAAKTPGSFRVYLGTDPETRRRQWLVKTIRGSKRFASQQLEELLEEAGRGRLRAGTVSDLLEH